MYPEVRIVLILLTAAAAAVSGWFASTAVSTKVATVRAWQRTEAWLAGAAARDAIEIEFGQEPDMRRVTTTADHMLGLEPLHRVTVYTDPSNPRHVQLGGFLQLWLWPVTITLMAVVCGVALAGACRLGRGEGVDDAMAGGRWTFAPPPPGAEGEIVVHRPASEARAPMFWSLLGVAAFCCGALIPGMGPLARLRLLATGGVFMVGTWMLALNNRTFRISGGSSGLRVSSALGWRQVGWELVKSVELREVSSAYHRPLEGDSLPFPGSTTKSVVFAGADGRTLLRMSTHMQPPEAAARLFDLCAARTGLTLRFRSIQVPDL